MKRSLWVRISLVIAMVMVLQVVLATNVAAKEPTVPPAAAGRWHLVRPGQTLWGIGHMYGVSWQAIARANGICNPYLLRAGRWILIPYARPCPRVYIVRRGDTLSAIACRFGTTIWAIVSVNHICNPHWIYTGQRLIIPDC